MLKKFACGALNSILYLKCFLCTKNAARRAAKFLGAIFFIFLKTKKTLVENPPKHSKIVHKILRVLFRGRVLKKITQKQSVESFAVIFEQQILLCVNVLPLVIIEKKEGGGGSMSFDLERQ